MAVERRAEVSWSGNLLSGTGRIQFTGSGYTLVAAPGNEASTVNLAAGVKDMAADINKVNLPHITLGSSQTFQTTVANATRFWRWRKSISPPGKLP